MTLLWNANWKLVSFGRLLLALATLHATLAATLEASAQSTLSPRIDLPTSKQMGAVLGDPQRLNSLPLSVALSPDARYVVTINAGYGTVDSGYDQSLAVMDTATGKVTDFPDERTGQQSKQTLFSGLAFSKDGTHVYTSMASLTNPAGDGGSKPGSGVQIYGFHEGTLKRERFLLIGPEPLAGSRRTKLIGGVDGATGVPFPAAIAVIGGAASVGTGPTHRDVMNGALGRAGGERLLVADNLSDDVLLIDVATGKVETRFDLSESDAVPSTYPIALAVEKGEARAFVALWNASEVVELDLVNGKVGRKLALMKPASAIAPGTHPCALEISGDGRTMYVALSNRDAVAAVDLGGGSPTHGEKTARNGAPGLGRFAVKGYFDTRLPGQSFFGAEPASLVLSGDGNRLYVGNMGSDAVAVIDTRKLTPAAAKRGEVEPVGFFPTELMPMALAMTGTSTSSGGGDERLYVATAKGRGTGPNNFAQKPGAGITAGRMRTFTYAPTLLYGSLAVVDPRGIDLKAETAEVMASNRMRAAEEKIAFEGGSSRIKHVLYLIKENRTYDQIFGDLKQNGTPVGNGDASLAMYGEATTPNQHKLALQFGVMDNFFDSAEVSGDGHVWSNAAIGTDYLEKTWQQEYRNGQRTYDYEGVVAEGYPLLQKIPDVVEPRSGYMWGNVDSHGLTHYNFGEYIATTFCDEKKSLSSQDGPVLAGSHCQPSAIAPGAALPAAWGGGVNKWPWAIPLIASNVATKPELVGHFAVEAPDFNLRVPDQIRMNVLLKHLDTWISDRAAGKDTMPNYITMRLGNDHTGGTVPGGPTPKSSVADNDLAVGRLVEAISHSAYWNDTAIFVLEDDAQNGADHVDAHRSIALAISKYAPRGKDGGAFVDSRFYSTVSVVRTMETLLGLPPMNNNDALSSMMGSMFTGHGDQAPFTADNANRENGLIYTANTRAAVGAKEAMKMDFRHEDHADPQRLNVILWKDAMGDAPVPAQLIEKHKKAKKDDDDD